MTYKPKLFLSGHNVARDDLITNMVTTSKRQNPEDEENSKFSHVVEYNYSC